MADHNHDDGDDDDDDSVTVLNGIAGPSTANDASTSAVVARAYPVDKGSMYAETPPPADNHEESDSHNDEQSVAVQSVDLLQGDDDDDDDAGSRRSHVLPIPQASRKKKTSQNSKQPHSIVLVREGEDPSSSTPSTSSSPVEGASSLLSPATQTLNALSQNMDDLRYNIMEESNSSSAPSSESHPADNKNSKNSGDPPRQAASTAASTATTPAVMPPPNPKNQLKWIDYRDKYERIPICLDPAPGEGLGVVIQRGQFFSASTPSSGSRSPGMPHCKILRVLTGGWAERQGACAKDWICRPASDEGSDTTSMLVLSDFAEVQAWSKRRPFRACILRAKNEPALSSLSSKLKATLSAPSSKSSHEDSSSRAETDQGTTSTSDSAIPRRRLARLGSFSSKKRETVIQEDRYNQGKWTTEEHLLFLNAYKTYGRTWSLVTPKIPTRTAQQVRSYGNRYLLNREGSREAGSDDDSSSSSNQDRSKGKGRAAEETSSRTNPSRSRQPNNIETMNDDEGVKLGKWTKEEELLFLEAHQKHGPQWSLVALDIPTRTLKEVGKHATKYLQKIENTSRKRKDRDVQNPEASSFASSQIRHEDTRRVSINLEVNHEDEHPYQRCKRRGSEFLDSSRSSKSLTMVEVSRSGATANAKLPQSMPFCRLCNFKSGQGHRKPRLHHSWCPLNPFFSNSGGDDLLHRIQQGRNKLQCSACKSEYQTGRLEPPKKHSQLCLQNQKRLHRVQNEEHERQKQEEKKEAEDKRRKRKNGERSRESRRRDLILSSSDEEEDDMLECSEYQPSSKKKGQIHTLTVSKTPTSSSATTPSSAKRQSNERDSSISSKPSKKKVSATPTSKAVTRRVTPQPAALSHPAQSAPPQPHNQPDQRTSQRQQQHQQEEPRNAETIKPIWASTQENPWGAHGYAEGDILLYGPHQGLGHYESVLPSPRYVLHPFAPHSNYRTTHRTPEEGFTVLSLTRDPMGVNPWGFNASGDEFGHACLVETVQTMSPAAAAISIGSESIAGLQIHDMIIMVNGESVGGMTEVGFELELETSGPRLTLVVSRYKHAAAARRQLAVMERSLLRVMDSNCRDERLLGWHEIGNASPAPASIVQQQPLGDNNPHGHALGQGTSENIPEVQMEAPEQHLLQIEEHCQHHEGYTPAPRSSKEKVDDEVISLDGEERPDYIDEDSIEVEPVSAYSLLLQDCVLNREVHESRDQVKKGYSSGSEASKESMENSKNDWDDDQNAWNGCVCGKVHSKSVTAFWIQCDSCFSWYDVSPRCIGFGKKQAEKIKKWICDSCPSESEESRSLVRKSAALQSTLEGDDEVLTNAQPSTQAEEEELLENNPGSRPAAEFLARQDTGSKDEKKCTRLGTELKRISTVGGRISPNSSPYELPDGSFRRPFGVAPKGYVWDARRGLWTPEKRISQAPQDYSGSQPANRVSSETDAMATKLDSVDGQNKKLIEQHAKNRDPTRTIQQLKGGNARLTTDSYVSPISSQKKIPDTTFRRPAGSAPRGVIWDELRGIWVPNRQQTQKQAPTGSKKRKPMTMAKTTVKQCFKDEKEMQSSKSDLPQTRSPGQKSKDAHEKMDDQPRESGQRGIASSLQSLNSSSQRKRHSVTSEEITGNGDARFIFQKGDLVHVQHHAWPGWDCAGGIGHITKSYVDNQGDRFYDVRYVVGSPEKGIDAEFVTAYIFN